MPRRHAVHSDVTSVALSWSGGKDSALALQALRDDPRVDVACLVTSVTREYDRVSVHGVRRELLHEQALRTGLPLIEIMLGAECTNEDYESAFLGALDEVKHRHPEVSAVAFGDLFLEDVRAYRERLDSSFAGRSYDGSLLSDLPAEVDPCGERGECHTFVSDGPIFSSPVPYRIGASVLRDDRFMFCDLE